MACYVTIVRIPYTLLPWELGRPIVWDAKCVDTVAPSNLPRISVRADAAVYLAEDLKRRKYAGLDRAYAFAPFKVETLGLWVPRHSGFSKLSEGMVVTQKLESICSILAPGGDAQPANLHCLLCGATEHLHLISDDHADQALHTHFGFTELPTGFICDSCKNYLKITVGFRALVEASRNRSDRKSKGNLTATSSKNTTILAAPTPGKTNLANPEQEAISLPRTSAKEPRKRRRRVINAKKSPTVIRKRVITVCVQCGHKYPAMVRSDSVLEYICSRCNQRNQNKEGKINSTLEYQKRFSLKGKTRLNCLSKAPQQVKPNLSSKTRLRNPKLCHKEISPKTTHLRQVHKGGSNLAWDKKITDNLAGHGAKYGGYLEQHIANKRVLILSKNEKPRQQTKNIWH